MFEILILIPIMEAYTSCKLGQFVQLGINECNQCKTIGRECNISVKSAFQGQFPKHTVIIPKQKGIVPKQHVMIPKQTLMTPKQQVMIPKQNHDDSESTTYDSEAKRDDSEATLNDSEATRDNSICFWDAFGIIWG